MTLLKWNSRLASSKVIPGKSPLSGHGLFAREEIKKGETVMVYGGVVVPLNEIMQYHELSHLGIQVNDNAFLCPHDLKKAVEIGAINHSCDPNCGFKDSVTVAALRKIKRGEEIFLDYAFMESHRFDFDCLCGSRECRKKVTPEDWKSGKLQEKYFECFSPYLKEKITRSRFQLANT